MKKVVRVRLKELRGSLSQAKFAQDLGLPQQTYANYETGRSEVGLALLCELSSKFGVSTDWLLGLPHAEAPAASAPPPSAEVARLWALVESQQRVIENLSRSPHAGSRQSASGAGEANGGVA